MRDPPDHGTIKVALGDLQYLTKQYLPAHAFPVEFGT